MKSPWVSREAYDALGASLMEERRRYENLRASYEVLLEKYHALKLAGAELPPAQMAPHLTALPAREPDELKALIHEKAGTDYRLRGMMLRQLTADRAAGKNEDKIRDEIERGIQSDGVPA